MLISARRWWVSSLQHPSLAYQIPGATGGPRAIAACRTVDTPPSVSVIVCPATDPETNEANTRWLITAGTSARLRSRTSSHAITSSELRTFVGAEEALASLA